MGGGGGQGGLRIVLDVVNSFESVWNWRLLLLPVPDWELHLTSNVHVQVLKSCHSLCLRRPQVKLEKQVLPNYGEEKETQRGRAGLSPLTASHLTASCGRTSGPKLPVHPPLQWGGGLRV